MTRAEHLVCGCMGVIALGFALSACSPAADEARTEVATPSPVSVVLHRVSASSGSAFQASGTVRLRRETPLAFLNDGRVRAVFVREGDRVVSGQQLATLDRTAIDAAATSADSRARQAAAELARQRSLLEKGWVSKARVESAEAAARAAEADRTSARFSQRFATITAPASGIVLARLAEPGQTLAAGTPVILLGELTSGFVLRVPLSAADTAGLAQGDSANVQFRDGAAPPMAARVIELAGRADPRTGTFQIEFALPHHPALRSGLIADVELPRARKPEALSVPATALFAARADEGFVWRFDPTGRTVSAALVRLGRVSDNGVEILSGLANGDLVVGAGVDRLTEGQSVQPVQTQPQTAAGSLPGRQTRSKTAP